jgi:hypothetical protein
LGHALIPQNKSIQDLLTKMQGDGIENGVEVFVSEIRHILVYDVGVPRQVQPGATKRRNAVARRHNRLFRTTYILL